MSTIWSFFSAFAAVHTRFEDGSNIGNIFVIGRLLNGMFNKGPLLRRLAPSWLFNSGLRVLSECPYDFLRNIPLEHLTYKVFFPLTTASARRKSSHHA